MKKDSKYPWVKNPSYFSPEWQKMRIRSWPSFLFAF
jgi:hypothetical protein